MIDVDPMAQDMAHLIGRVGGDLEGSHITKAPSVGDRAGTVHPVEAVVIGQRHDSHPTVGGQVSHLVRVAPAVADSGMHVEIGQHALSLPATFGVPWPSWLSKVTDFFRFPVGDE